MAQSIPGWARQFPPDNPLSVTLLLGGVATPIPLNTGTGTDSTRNHILIGRNPENEIFIEELSCSRKHALIVYGDGPEEERLECAAYWICDLGTQNGSCMNNHIKMEPQKFYNIKRGYFFQFGINQMSYLFEYKCDIVGVDVDTEESPVGGTATDKHQSKYTDWGQNYDDIEMAGTTTSAIVNTEPAPPVDNPIQVVKNYFKREGFDFNPEFVQLSTRFHKVIEVTLILPIEDTNNEESNETALTSQGDNKQEALHRVCKLAYELLHSRDLLNKQVSESYVNRKKRQLVENDFYDSDEDTFYDRTGSIEHKRDRRIQHNQTLNDSNPKESLVVSSSSAGYKSYFDRSSKYVSSKKLSSRLSELDKHLIRVKSELQRAKNKKEQFVVNDNDTFDDETDLQIALSEQDQLSSSIRVLKEKLKQLTKERECLLDQLRHSKRVENDPELLKSVTANTTPLPIAKSQQLNVAAQKDNSIVEEIIKSYTNPLPAQKKPLPVSPATTSSCPKDNPELNNKSSSTLNRELDEKLKVDVHKTPENSPKYNQPSPTNIDPRDMVESEVEQLIDDSPISWAPQTESAIKHQDSLKDKYGY